MSAELLPYLSFFLAFGITYFSIPAIIRLSLVKKLYDLPDHRKQHGARISSLGGMAIFGGLIISFVFCSAHLVNPALNSVLVALFILFITGVKDDLYPLVPYKKLLGQLLAVGVLIFQGNVRLSSFYGLFGINELPYAVSVLLSGIFFLGIINSFNFIDGINGLSSGLGFLVSLVYAFLFYYLQENLFLVLALSIAGAQLAFLRYNLFNARIFMGDSGSLILGFLVALQTIYFLQANEQAEVVLLRKIDALVFALSIIIIPVMDTVRVVLWRIFVLKRSPFAADRNHIHHALLDIGLSHAQATFWLVGVNALIIILTYWANQYIRASLLLVLLVLISLLLAQIPFYIKRKQKKSGRYQTAH